MEKEMREPFLRPAADQPRAQGELPHHPARHERCHLRRERRRTHEKVPGVAFATAPGGIRRSGRSQRPVALAGECEWVVGGPPERVDLSAAVAV